MLCGEKKAPRRVRTPAPRELAREGERETPEVHPRGRNSVGNAPRRGGLIFLPICMLSGLISAISFRRASVEGATSLSTPSISQSATPPPGSMTTVCLFFSRLGEQGTEAAWEGGLELTCLRDLSRCLAGFSKAAQLLSKYSFLMHATHTDHNVFT